MLGTYRAFAIRHALVAGLYRNRALWTGLLGLIVALHGATVTINTLGLVTFPPAGSGLPVAGPAFFFELLDYGSYLAVVIFAVALTDSATLVALDRDFFHRDTLHWKKLRIAVYPVVLIYDATRLLGLYPASSSADLASNAATGGLAIAVSFAVANLVVSGNRVKDRPVKMYNLYLGLAAALFVVTIVLYGYPPPADYLYAVAIVLSSLSFFKMTTSLSPTSRIKREL